MNQLGGRYLDETELGGLGFKKIGQNVRVHSSANIYGLQNIQLGDNSRIDDFTLIVATGELSIARNNWCRFGDSPERDNF